MKLIHYGEAPLLHVRSVTQGEEDGSCGFGKPRGLWVSVEGPDDWMTWCEAEGFRPDRLQCATEVVLQEKADILYLRSAADIDRFTQDYGCMRTPLHLMPDWRRVAQKHQGIVVAPYIWERRMEMHTFWYYGWDCASGCIWDADAIAFLQPAAVRKSEVLA